MAKINVATRKQVEELSNRAQTKRYTETKAGVAGTTDTTITGCGRIQFWPISTSVGNLTLTVDGLSVASGAAPFSFGAGGTKPQVEVYFGKSVVFKANAASTIGYLVQT